MEENTATKGNELEKIDITSFLNDFAHRVRRSWWIVLLLAAGFAAVFYLHVRTSYSPTYVAEATVSVEAINASSSSGQTTAEQLQRIFPFIYSSGLSDTIAADLGMGSVPGSIRVSWISGTSLLSFQVSSYNAEHAYNILQTVIQDYPDAALSVLGQTEFVMVDDSGVPRDTGRTAVLRGSMIRGAALGFVLGVLILALIAAVTATVHSESDLRKLLNVSCLGTLPFCVQKRRRRGQRSDINILSSGTSSEYVEAIRLIRTRLERQMDGKKVLMVTSSVSGEGKSTVAANLAISMALKGKKVVLVDCDLRNPTIGKIFRVKSQFPGLVSALQGTSRIEESMCEVMDRNNPIGLTLLLGGEPNSKLVEVLSSETMKNVVDQLKQQFDVVILDTPPSAILVDAMMLVRYVDAVAYVVMSEFARKRYIFEGVEELTSSGAPIAGCILNGGRSRSGGYGYYGGYRRYGYGSYGGGYPSGKIDSGNSGSGRSDPNRSATGRSGSETSRSAGSSRTQKNPQ